MSTQRGGDERLDDGDWRMVKQNQGESGQKANDEGKLSQGEGAAVFAQDNLGQDD